MTRFVHVRATSAYSLLRGAIKIPKLIALAKQHRMPALALTDHDNLFGSLEFSMAAAKEGIQPIIGINMRVVTKASSLREEPDHLLLYAKDEVGYQHLLALSSKAYLSSADSRFPSLTYADIFEKSNGLLALTGGIHGGIGKALIAGKPNDAHALLKNLREAFGDRIYVELQRHRLPQEKTIERAQIDLALEYNVPLIATNSIYFTDQTMFEAHDALSCVFEGRYVNEDDRPRLNADHRFKSAEEMALLFRDIPEAIENTLHFAKRCQVFSPQRSPILPGFHITNTEGEVLSESDALRLKAHQGLRNRLEKHVYPLSASEEEKSRLATPYIERLEFELDVIITMKFPGYFLIVSDFIVWAKQQRIPVGPGRGSGAGSLVAWALFITDLDPIAFGLIFERFLNPERVSMPDFDIDFCQDRRDEVIRYVQQKYGADRVAQIITFGKLQARAVLRDVGRVLQMPYGQVDRICKLVPNNPAAPVTLEEAVHLEPLLKQAIAEDESVTKLVNLSVKLEGLYRHASTHAAGVVIADRPLQELVPLYRDPKSDMLVVQYSMKYAEEAGLVKFDFLGLKTLTVIQQTLDMLEKRGITIDITTIPFDDKATFAMLGRGETLGVFQFESAGMQAALRELKPDHLDDLVALGALYRPGPMENIPTYIACKHGKERPDYLHPMLTDVLRETYGVIIYQEQVQKIAQIMAGYTLGAADLLRRAMGKKIKSEMDAQRAIFTEGAKKNGVPEAQASNIFDLVAKFAGYGFNKSHAAAYAVVAYQTAYLRANYPVEFFAASMNYEMSSTDKLSQFVQEAKRIGIQLLSPDINASQPLFSVEKNGDAWAIRYGLAAIKNVGMQAMQAIIDERVCAGAFASPHDFAERMDSAALNKRQLEHLIMAGAMDAVHHNRRQFFESIDTVLAHAALSTQERQSSQANLFDGAGKIASPVLQLKNIEEWSEKEKLHQEYNAIGFYLSAHPLGSYEAALKNLSITSSIELEKKLTSHYASIKLAGMVMGTKIKASPKGRFAFIQLSDASGSYEVTIYDEGLLNQTHSLLRDGEAVYIEADGKIVDGSKRLIAQKIIRLEEKLEQSRLKSLQLECQNIQALDAVCRHLKTDAQGGEIVFLIPVENGKLKISLQDRYMLTPMLVHSLKQIESLTLKVA